MRAIVMLIAWLMMSCAGATSAQRTTTAADAPTAQGEASNDLALAAWSQRMQAAEAERAIQSWTQRVGEQPSDSQSWLRLAQAHHFVATVHASDSTAVIQHAQTGLDAAQHATESNDDSVANVTALYWRARNLAVLAAAQGYAEMLIIDAELDRLLSACERLQAGYDHSGSLILLAQRLARPIDIARRDLVAARKLFTRALAAEPGYLPHRVALAEHYAVVARDRALFEHELLETRDAVLPTSADAELHLAQTRARHLLTQIDELFE